LAIIRLSCCSRPRRNLV